MNDQEKTNYFIELYMTALRAFYQNPFLKEPNPISERYSQLDKARQIVDILDGEYSDFINFQFQSFRQLRIAPKPHHLISGKAIKRYQSYQRKNNRYHTKEYSTNGDFLTVSSTRKIYPISQILLPTSQDSIASFAYSLLEMENCKTLSKVERDRNKEALSYLIAKLKYKKAQVPESIIELWRRYEKETLHSILAKI